MAPFVKYQAERGRRMRDEPFGNLLRGSLGRELLLARIVGD